MAVNLASPWKVQLIKVDDPLRCVPQKLTAFMNVAPSNVTDLLKVASNSWGVLWNLTALKSVFSSKVTYRKLVVRKNCVPSKSTSSVNNASLKSTSCLNEFSKKWVTQLKAVF